MKEVEMLRIVIPGAFDDALLYKGELIGLTEEQTLVRVELDEILAATFEASNDLRLAELYISRNDLLLGEGVRRLMQLPEIEALITRLTPTVPRQPAGLHWGGQVDFDFGQTSSGEALDFIAHYDQLFLAATSGIYQMPLYRTGGRAYTRGYARRSDTPCVSLAARSGSILASCEENGLLVSLGHAAHRADPVVGAQLKRVASSSVRVGWLGPYAINYRDARSVEAFRTKYAKEHSGVIEDLTPDGALLRRYEGDREMDEREGKRVTYSYNDQSLFLDRFSDSSFLLQRRSWHRGRLGLRQKTLQGEMSQPISAHALASGLVVELLDQTILLDAMGEISLIHDGQAVTVRTFPNSKRYQNVVVVITEDALILGSPIVHPWNREDVADLR